MTNDRENAEMATARAQAALELAAVEAVRAEIAAELLAQQGLTCGDLGDGDHFVACDGVHLGNVRRQAPGASPLLHWYAYTADGGEPTGPYLTARQAAVSLLRKSAASAS